MFIALLHVCLEQNQLLEAELCVQDCHDCGVDEAEREQEIVSAHLAVDEAVACLVDLLDESRAATHSAHHHQLPTEELVRRIKQLRAELSKLKAPPLIDAKE